MGLGKTVQGCALIQCYRDEWPAVVFTPSSLRGQWAEELKKWLHLTDEDILVVYNPKDAERVRVGSWVGAELGRARGNTS